MQNEKTVVKVTSCHPFHFREKINFKFKFGYYKSPKIRFTVCTYIYVNIIVKMSTSKNSVSGSV